MALDITNQTFEKEVLQSEIPVLVDFWAPWCGPCRMMAPILDELSTELGGRVKITKLNTEIPEHMPIAMTYQISSIPNMKLFHKGNVVEDFIGFRPKEIFKEELESAIKNLK